LLIAFLDRDKRERYERVRGRFEGIDYTSAFHIGDIAKVIGFYGRLLVENLDIRLAEFTAAFFLEATEIKDEWRTQSLFQLRKSRWRIHTNAEEEAVATKGEYQIRLQWFICPRCDRPVFACLLCYPIADVTPKLPVQHPWCRQRGADMIEAYRPYEVRTRGKAHLAKETNLEEVATLLSDCRAIALTGAGISKASGILTFSAPEGLETGLKMSKKEFLDGLFHSLFEEPAFVVREVAKFQVSFLMAKPNPAHLALAELERKEVLNFIITENGDELHHEAGSKKVLEIWELEGLRKHFLETQVGWEAIKSAGLFLVIGVGWDEHGLIEYARDNSLKILAIGPERPSFLTEGDLYLCGRAEELLPKILKILKNS